MPRLSGKNILKIPWIFFPRRKNIMKILFFFEVQKIQKKYAI